MNTKLEGPISVIVLVFIASLLIVACSTTAMSPEEVVKEDVVSFLELCRKGHAEEAYTKYLSDDAYESAFLEEEFEYSILNVVEDDQIEDRYIAMLRFEFSDGKVMNATIGYDIERGQIDYILWVLRN